MKEVIDLLSRLTSFTLQSIRQHLEHQVYSEVKIPKGGGKFRTLHIPEESLKRFQKSILERVLYFLPVSPAAHCGVPSRSIKTHTTPHLKSGSFFKIDFKEAFPSITQEMVIERLTPLLGKWIEPGNSQPRDLAILISRLTTYKNALPQGAPTSTYLLNLVCYDLDKKLLEIANKHCLVYTRYADDLWFSSREPKIPKEARCSIVEVVQKYGFKINREKVRYKTGRATVPKITGINLQWMELKIPRKSIEEYRGRIHLAANNPKVPVEEILGIISWVTMVESRIPKRLREVFKTFLENRCPERKHRYARML